MCGFLGYSGNSKITEYQFSNVLVLSKLRGPDQSKIVNISNAYFGFNRLAIQDLTESGSQPKYNSDLSCIMLFNGEIYNHIDLRLEFNLKNCKGHGDSETLFNLFCENDIFTIIPRLNGMFAGAWYDENDNSIVLFRDFAGIKPLFYYLDDDNLIFASQLDQIIQFPIKMDLSIDVDGLKDYYALGTMISPNTVFQKIKQINPGEILKISLINYEIVKSVKFYNFNRLDQFDNQHIESILPLMLNEVVGSQLITDVKFACLLSGGIDSPIITHFAKNNYNDILAYTFGNKYSQYHDESENALKLAKIIGVNLNLINYNNDKLKYYIDEILDSLSEPNGDFGLIPFYILTKEIPGNIKVLISGDGGDELFFGYNRHSTFLKYRLLIKLNKFIKRLINKFILWFGNGKIPDSIIDNKDYGRAYFQNMSSIENDKLNSIFSVEGHSKKYFDSKNYSELNFLTYIDFNIYLQGVLRKVDLVSMANSKEVRVPFLDKKILNLAKLYNPLDYKKFVRKKPLYDLFINIFKLPNPKKKGFSLPINHVLRVVLKEDIESVIIKKELFGSEHLDRKIVVAMVDDFFVGKSNNYKWIWHVYVLQKWAIKNNLVK